MMSQLPLHAGEARRRAATDPGHRTRRARRCSSSTWRSTRRPSTTPRAPGVPAHRRPAGADRRRALRLRDDRQRPRRQGLPYFVEDVRRRSRISSRRARCSRRRATRTSRSRCTRPTSCPGFVEAATLFAEQAREAGVTVNIKKEAANAYFDTSLLYTKLAVRAVLLDVLVARRLVHAGAALGRRLERDALPRRAVRRADPGGEGATDESSAQELWDEVQQRQSTRAATSCGRPEHRRRRRDERGRDRAQLVLQPGRLELPGRLAADVTDTRAPPAARDDMRSGGAPR